MVVAWTVYSCGAMLNAVDVDAYFIVSVRPEVMVSIIPRGP